MDAHKNLQRERSVGSRPSLRRASSGQGNNSCQFFPVDPSSETPPIQNLLISHEINLFYDPIITVFCSYPIWLQ